MILVVVGTRPELLKMSGPVKLARERGLPIHVHCTMQSPDLVDMAILPWQSSGPVDPIDGGWDFCVVQGDTRTAFAAAVSAFEHGIPVFHLEAGVRTYDLSAPWPEEGYRQMISRIARWHACTTVRCHDNLVFADLATRQSEARVTGSPIVESVRERVMQFMVEYGNRNLANGVPGFVLVTLHRRENRGHFRNILLGVDDASSTLEVMWYQHPNSWAVEEAPDGLSFASQPPCPSDLFATLLKMARVVVTDSGGVQEEANALGVPCVVARTVTDRPESLGKGGAILGGNTRESIATAIQEALKLDRSQIDPTIFGDGKASERIVDWWTQILEGKC